VLDISLENVTYGTVHGSAKFDASTHTAIAGLPGAGASTLLRLIAGDLRPERGDVRIGTRVVTALPRAKRPLLFVTSALDVPRRWSVQHALVAAVRTRTLDRVDRQHEYRLALEKWRLERFTERRIGTLSESEATLVHLARIELLKPAIVVADRLFASLNPSMLTPLADEFHRTLRVMGTTLIAAPSTHLELGWADRVIVLHDGAIVQEGTPAGVYASPGDAAAARATGEVNEVPVTVRGSEVESPVGAWQIDAPPFEGAGIALVRPDAFAIARPGEDSDFIFAVEEATFRAGRWQLRGLVSGGVELRVDVAGGEEVHKGKLLPLRYDAGRFRLIR
jgi:ABC-type Fe3+/spermidine/putrescine transport system ATPase subunit